MEKPLFVSVKEAVRLTGLSRTTLYLMMSQGALAWTKCRGRRLVVRASIEALLPRSSDGFEQL